MTSALLVSLCLAVAIGGIALELASRRLRPEPARAPVPPARPIPSLRVAARPRSLDAAAPTPPEQQRWVAVLTVPLAFGALSVAAALATDASWFFAGALALVPVWIGALAYLALSSDTNGHRGQP